MVEPWGCSACGATFSSLTGFDAHRVGTPVNVHPDYGRSCLTAEQIAAKGYVLTAKGVWAKPLTPEQAAKLKALKRRVSGEEE
jgi:hypothetical protein